MGCNINELKELLKTRILVLDGAMGTMLQAGGLSPEDFNRGPFKDHPIPLTGNNDVLCITRPEAVKAVHKKYLDAGADIIETNTFNSNAVSQAEYGLADRVYDLAFAGAKVAREAADEAERGTPGRRCFVAGSIGPTGKTASMSPSVEDPAARNVTFDELAAAYRVQMEGLYDGGADIFLFETAFDTLNVKAAVYASQEVMESRKAEIPVMISATLSDASGRMLAGQSAEAFLISVLHARNLLSVGFNCALGPDEIRPHVAALAAAAPVFVSTHPNAGLPDAFGKYVQTPEHMGEVIRSFAEDGLVNIVGGCCGTTPAHIAKIAQAVKGIAPRKVRTVKPVLRLAGLDPFTAENSNFINVGERTNVAGSRKFLRLIQADDMHEAMSVAAHQIEAGAAIIDVNMDDPMLDAASVMKRFLLYAASEPDIARVPVMIDSSDWNVVKTALRCVQGKAIVNSISLKEGEELFLMKAREIRRLGASVLVMAFDENGQADTLQRRVDVLTRSYHLLTGKAGIPPEDIVFDPNVFAVATGMREHDHYAKDFIESVRELHKRFPLCGISGGISNVSFSFRGNDPVRGAIHTVFLKHAIDAGLTMGIVNAAQLGVYDDLPAELRSTAEAVVLNTSPDAAEKLLAIAGGLKPENKSDSGNVLPAWRSEPLAERITHALVKGDDSFVETDMREALTVYESPMKIVEGPLMDGMARVGELFGSGRMFLPQVVKSARVMKRSVSVLMPDIEKMRGSAQPSARILLATVKGDVHDIGKNIVSVVLQCNNCEVTDLGVMVPADVIVNKAMEIHADVIGLSGLITPSLKEMENVCMELERRGLSIPVIVGGAAASELHTAMKLQPLYHAPVIYARDASADVPVVAALTSDRKDAFVADLKKRNAELLAAAATKKTQTLIPLDEARKRAVHPLISNPKPLHTGVFSFEFTVPELLPGLDWDSFTKFWGTPKEHCCACDLIRDARSVLERGSFRIRCAAAILPANSENEDILVYTDESRSSVRAVIPTLRGQTESSGFRCPADLIAPVGTPDWIAMLTLSVTGCAPEQDDYTKLLSATLANWLAESAAESVHRKIRREFWGYETGIPAPKKYRGVRPAPGYPMLPEHKLKKVLFDLMYAEKNTGARLTESFMMIPESSVCALCIAADSDFFAIGPVSKEQEDIQFRKI